MGPPPYFVGAGLVDQAFFSPSPPPFLKQRRYTGRRAEGIRYEKKVHEYLLSLFPDSYLPSPWLRFRGDGRWRWCQPDGLIFDVDTGRIIIVEVKYSHTSDAWWQVMRLYLPVLKKCFAEGDWTFEACEVVRWFDPAISFPVPLLRTPLIDQESQVFKVHIWK